MPEKTIEHCEKCGHIGFQLIPEPEESIHNAKIVCSNCGAFQKWAGKPRTDPTDLGRCAVYDEDWRFNFGKYNDQFIREVMHDERGLSYCQWITGKQTDFNEKCSALVDLLNEIAEEERIEL